MKRSLLLLLLCAFAYVASAVSAYPGYVNYRQPDGTTVKVRLMGDEFFHWAITEDGYTLLPDVTGYMTLAMPNAEGQLCPSQYRMADIPRRDATLLSAMRQVRPRAAFSAAQIESVRSRVTAMRRAKRQVITSDDPVVGFRKYLVILMQFPDVKFQKTSQEFNRLLNEVGYTDGGNSGSVHDFYDENSFGQLDLQCDVAGVFTASHPMSYYGNNTNGNPYALAIEALTLASAQYDIRDYDVNGDGYIDGVHIVFAGYGEEAGGSADCIWSHEATTTGTFCEVNGVKMNAYSCTPELSGNSGTVMSKIGVICHEIGHALGTLDYYDTNYEVGGQYPGTGSWDVMGSGNWNNNGATPAHFNPYSKIYDFKWSGVLDGNKAQRVTLHAKQKDNFVRIDTKTTGEFFLLENRQKSGFDGSLPGHGLMVYRCSDNMSAVADNTINAYHKQQFYPLCANATSALPTSVASTYGTPNSASAPFPGTLNRTSLTDATTPSMKDWNGRNTGFPITDIIENTSQAVVTFNIAGGDGSLYGLEVEDATTSSLQLRWGNDDSKDVMLVYNTEDEFGTPASRSYSVGSTVTGGGTVVYVGRGATFTHTGLSDGNYYYYRLYSRPSGSYVWSQPLEVGGRTVTESIKEFPYTENFESGVLDGGWRHELIEGTNEWKVQKEWNLTSYVLYYNWDWDKGTRQSARAVMPAFNFSGKQNALLEFDYRNMLIDMSVVYRTSSTGVWHQLSELNNHYTPNMSNADAYNSEEHAVILLPNISSTYEIAFVSDFSWRGNSKSSTEVGTIDNIKVTADFGAYVETQNTAKVAGTFAEINFLCIEGIEPITAKGVEWSTNQSTWTKVAATQNSQTVSLNSLPAATTIYYRSYVQTNKGNYTGKTLTFKTLQAGNGTGTEDDPILIANADDWNKLKTAVNGGNNMAGIHYALANSITLPSNYSLTKEFRGQLDGRAFTIDLGTTASNPLFCTLGKNGVVKNLNVECAVYATGGFEKCSPVTGLNYGTVTHCDVRIDVLKLPSYRGAAGFCSKNYGTISYCHSYINLTKENMYLWSSISNQPSQADVGGICWYNFGLIDYCTFDGDMVCNNNSKLAGIAAVNYYESDEQRGHITNCLNRGTLRIVLIDDKAWGAEIGGIVGSNYGLVEYCVNEGNLIGDVKASDCHVGGIVAGSSSGSSMSHCLNRGTITVNILHSSAKVGGIIAYNDRTTTSYCVNVGDFDISGLKGTCCRAVAGDHRDATMTGCYYDCNITDSKATRVTSWENTFQTLNDAAGFECWKWNNGQPILYWEGEGTELPDPNEQLPDSNPEFTYYIIGENSVAITGFSSAYTSTVLNIPKEVTYRGKVYHVVEIKGYAFAYNSTITSINLPEGLRTLGEEAINGLSSLTSLVIPASVDSICGNMTSHLGETPRLTQIIVDGNNQKYCSVDGVLFSKDMKTLIKYPAAKVVETYIVPEGVESVCSQAFRYCRTKHVVLPQSTKHIAYLFVDCKYKMEALTVCALTPPTVYGSTFVSDAPMYDLYVPYASLDLYRNHDLWKQFKTITAYDPPTDPEPEPEPEPEPDGPIEHPDYSTMGNVLYMDDAKASAGKQITLPVLMNNTGDVAAFEFDLYVPEGLSVATDSKGKYLIKRVTDRMYYEEEDGTKIYSHTIQSALKEGKYIKVICTSATNDIFKGNEGAVATITFDVAKDAEPGVYAVKIRNEKLTHLNTRSETFDEAVTNITVMQYTLGDVNDDGEINSGDYVGVVNLILDTDVEDLIREAADVNEDNEVDTGDCVGIINYVLYDSFVPQSRVAAVSSACATPVMGVSDFSIRAGEMKEIAFTLDNMASDFTALQMDIALPEGLSLVNTRWVESRTNAERHSLRCAMQADGKLRLVGSSAANETFEGHSGALLLLTVKAEEELDDVAMLSIDNIKLVETNTNVVRLDDVAATVSRGDATSVSGVAVDADGNSVYDLSGRRTRTEPFGKSVYIINHKKAVKQ